VVKTDDAGPATAAVPPPPPGSGRSSTSGLHQRVAPPISEPRAAPGPQIIVAPVPAGGPVEYDLAELDAPADIDLARKRLVLDVFYGLERLSHYELLQLPTDADKKAVKGKYFDIVSVFHPDKYFGKN